MTQVLSTFNRLEQSRFEAFRRSSFRGDVISAYVAHCLATCQERAYARGEKTRQYLGAHGLGVSPLSPQHVLQHCPYVKNGTPLKRSLDDMVAPGQADEITVVVSTLAKAYAQRLVTAARRVAAAEGLEESQPLQPSHLLKAHHSRVHAGLDPGFFLQKPRATAVTESCSAVAAALGIVDKNELARNAALAAQEEYDKYMESKNEAMDVDEATPVPDEAPLFKEAGKDDEVNKDEQTAENIEADRDAKIQGGEDTSNDEKTNVTTEPAADDEKALIETAKEGEEIQGGAETESSESNHTSQRANEKTDETLAPPDKTTEPRAKRQKR